VRELCAIVMAAGEGRRLRPLTERWAKAVLPIDGRAVIATLLRELAAAGVERVFLVSGHLAGQVEALAGDGSAFGLEIVTTRQPEPVGSADAVRRALAAGAKPPLLACAADTVFPPGDVGRAARDWLASTTPGGLGVRASSDPDKTRVTVAAGRLASLGEGDGPLAAAPLWFLGEELVAALDAVPGPPYELAHVIREALAAGMEIRALALGATRDLTRPADVVMENFPYLWNIGS
jgi:dTDP-glucose pyrophosphorylase